MRWLQATLPLSQYLPSGTYAVGELRATDVTGNGTVVTPDENPTLNAVLTVASLAQTSGNVVATSDDDSNAAAKDAPRKPAECDNSPPKGPFFTALSFSKTSGLSYGDTITATAYIVDCDPTTGYRPNSAKIFLLYSGGGKTQDGPQADFTYIGLTNQWTAKIQLWRPVSCPSCNTVSVKRLEADNKMFTPGGANWPSYSSGTFK